MFTHKKICTSIVGLLSPTFGVQIKVGELSVTYSYPSAANGVENQRFSYVAQLLREFVREKGAMRRVLLERG